jgi:hypothetical protein
VKRLAEMKNEKAILRMMFIIPSRRSNRETGETDEKFLAGSAGFAV